MTRKNLLRMIAQVAAQPDVPESERVRLNLLREWMLTAPWVVRSRPLEKTAPAA
jgi:hypothetical protein